jgi:hypothetical protein
MPSLLPDLVEEFAASLGDLRLNRRLKTMVAALAAEPAQSLPRALGDVAGVEGGYRFLRNPRVKPDALSAPHRDATWTRAAEADGTILAVEDTTEVRFNGTATRDGLGTLINDGQGFYLHGALLVEMQGTGQSVPLGVAAYETMVRPHGRASRKRGTHWKRRYSAPDNERLRWHRVADAVAEEARARQLAVVHVADREADEYSLLSRLIENDQRFVVRLRFDRRTLDDGEWASTIVERAEGMLEREVAISARTKLGDGRRKSKNPRNARTATLTFRAAEVTFPRPRHAKNTAAMLRLHLVDVVELSPPPGEEPVRWMLLTTEPIGTGAEIERIVDIYRGRWLIEELWKALKTGCAYEDRQLESRTTLENALALFVPIAWHMLLIRSVARAHPDAPATSVVTYRQLNLLRRIAALKNRWGLRLPEEPTARDILLGIARMGGHLPQNGEPGWLVLRRGLDDLYALEYGAALLETDEM